MSMTLQTAVYPALMTAGLGIMAAAGSWWRRVNARIVEQVEAGRLTLEDARIARAPLRWAIPLGAVGVAFIAVASYWRAFR